jgi:hypothetical protein
LVFGAPELINRPGCFVYEQRCERIASRIYFGRLSGSAKSVDVFSGGNRNLKEEQFYVT